MPTCKRETAALGRAGDTSELLRQYRALEFASEQMLEAARGGDWDRVCRIEGACAVIVAQLRKQLDAQGSLAGAEQSERIRILKAILANDAQLRRICQPLPGILEADSFLAPQTSRLLH